MKLLRDLFREHVAQTSGEPLGMEVERAEGVFLYGSGGRRVYDLISGVSVANVGHGRPEVVEAVQEQAGKYMHAMVYGELVEAPQVRLATRLAEVLPEGLDSVYFVNSGAEAIEGAVKLAKRATGRRKMVAFRRAYHGSTHAGMSLMGPPEGDEWRRPFEPLLPEVEWLEFNDFEGLGRITGEVACVVAEVVQGEAGVRLPEEGFLQAVRRRCTEEGAMLVYDEVQTGMGRTGRMFAFEKWGVAPDILVLAKALGGGMPLGAFIARREVMSLLAHDPALGHITTFGGHPVSCAAGLAAMEVILGEGLMEEVEEKGAMFEEAMEAHSAVREVRRAGLLMAVEMGVPVEGLVRRMLEKGVMSDWFLFCDTAFRISPPLTITKEEIKEVCGIITKCLDEENFG